MLEYVVFGYQAVTKQRTLFSLLSFEYFPKRKALPRLLDVPCRRLGSVPDATLRS